MNDTKNDDWIRNIHKGLIDVDERMKRSLAEDVANISKNGAMQKTSLPEIKGLELLMEGIYTVDVERTITDMTEIIKNTESQLDKVLTINSHLGKDLKVSKEMIAYIKGENKRLADKIEQMEDDIPHKRELQAVIEQLVDERNKSHNVINDFRHKAEMAQVRESEGQKRIYDLIEETKDSKREIGYLENKLNGTIDQLATTKRKASILYSENISYKDKVSRLEAQLKESLDERYKLLRELKESKAAIGEIRSSLTAAKLQSKRYFYEASDEKKAEVIGSGS
jgi:chromosome segregation ATPase